MNKIQVAIVDDDVNWIKELTSFLNAQGDIRVAWYATNKEDTVQLARSSPVDFILMDINLETAAENYDGIEATKAIFDCAKTTRIIMMTSIFQEDVNVIKKSIFAGAVDYKAKRDFLNIPDALRSTYYQLSTSGNTGDRAVFDEQ
jgi:DNA-binding NarL/FixJ family response regulator